MEFLTDYADQISGLLSWASNPETTVPVAKLLQGIAAIIGALVSTLGFYKAWRFAEKRLGKRLAEFIEQEEAELDKAREAARAIRDSKSFHKRDALKIFTNAELQFALKTIRKGKWSKAEHLLTEALARTQERERFAQTQAHLHGRQRAAVHLLMGALADERREHHDALAHFQSALEFNPHDLEALEYVGLQNLKLGNPKQALEDFNNLIKAADAAGEHAILARAWLNHGRAQETMLPTGSFFNANIAYKNALQAMEQSNGSPLDVAYIHELRGKANIELRNLIQANNSLMHALTRYSQLEHTGNGSAREASLGVERIHKALEQLAELNNGGNAREENQLELSATT